jgi:alpha/beta superfamily hydrolase
VVAHPHPLHGGTLHNPVVFHADRALHRAGFTTLRFNFRGVGASDGTHDAGRGEIEDVGAAVAWLRGVSIGLPLFVVGFSFGSLCGIRYAVGDAGVVAVIAIGLPVSRDAIPELAQLNRPLAVVQASDDELGSPAAVRALVERADPPGAVHVVAGTTHLFPGRAPDAGAAVVAAALALLDRLA